MELIPEKYRDKPEKYFEELERQGYLEEIIKLKERILEIESKCSGYRNALYEILLLSSPTGFRCIRPRVTDIRSVLKRFPEIKVPEKGAE